MSINETELKKKKSSNKEKPQIESFPNEFCQTLKQLIPITPEFFSK